MFYGIPPASAHDPRATVSGSTTVTFGYTDGTPMAFVSAQIFGPGDTIAYLETTTDRAGRISFQPNRDGDWRAEASDGRGHQLTITMSLANGVPLGTGKGLPDGVVALSLVLNLVLGSLAVGSLRKKLTNNPDYQKG